MTMREEGTLVVYTGLGNLVNTQGVDTFVFVALTPKDMKKFIDDIVPEYISLLETPK